MKNIIILYSTILILISVNCFAWNPIINKNDYVFTKSDSGYELFIRKKDDIESILLTESQKWADSKKTNYGLRTEKYFEANSDEKRILDGKELSTRYDAFFLVDSTTEKHETLGQAFRYFLPEKVLFGYDWSRKGEINIKPGIRINLRIFEQKYANYEGQFKDQWITLDLFITDARYNKKFLEDMKNTGKIIIKNIDDNNDDFFKKIIPENISIAPKQDIVFLIDTTSSMIEEFPSFKKVFPEICIEISKKVKYFRIGFIFYRDYGEKYITKIVELSDNMDDIFNQLYSEKIEGGQDVPEALNEAMYNLSQVNFNNDAKRTAFIIGDAPAHSEPRDKITNKMALDVIQNLNIKINALCLPFR
ncbi:MAG TPA: hypothetical protein DDY71_08940 [Spirochaetia bacterium]|nr:hypothetical protein [Spirochaetia bacterium]HBI37756.1 hypothetical protein [Spirochaetia bacterium]